MEGVQAAMTTRNLEPDQWRNREEWRLVSGRRRQLLKNGQIDRSFGKALSSGDQNVPPMNNFPGTSISIPLYFAGEEAFPLKPRT